jgi:hypothetical protein
MLAKLADDAEHFLESVQPLIPIVPEGRGREIHLERRVTLLVGGGKEVKEVWNHGRAARHFGDSDSNWPNI